MPVRGSIRRQIKYPVVSLLETGGIRVREQERRRIGLDRNPVEQVGGRLDNILLAGIPGDREAELPGGTGRRGQRRRRHRHGVAGFVGIAAFAAGAVDRRGGKIISLSRNQSANGHIGAVAGRHHV